jgi:ribosome-interacting GTPase 1
MPTNLPAEAKIKWYKASISRNPKEKLKLLQEFLSLVPKHKGTEKLRAQVRRKLALLRREVGERKRRKLMTHGSKFSVEKDGAAQIVILGQTNVGRSSFLSSCTNARVVISRFPFTTREPVLGMLSFEDLKFQIVEAPAVSGNASKKSAWENQTMALARNADGLILMVDLSRDPCDQFSIVVEELEKARIFIRKPKAKVEIERRHLGVGLRVFVIGRLVGCTLKQVESLCRSYGIHDAIVKIYGSASLDDIENSIFESGVFRPAIVVANKFDIKGAERNFRKLRSLSTCNFETFPVSCKTRLGLNRLGAALFRVLEIMRVYTKELGKRERSSAPFVLKSKSTIADLASRIHSDFRKNFSYAKVWSTRLSFSPQRVGLSFLLDDKDTVELHMR